VVVLLHAALFNTPEEGRWGQVQEVRGVPGDQEQDHQSAEGHSYQVRRGWACPCSEEGGEQGGREYQRLSCSEIDPS